MIEIALLAIGGAAIVVGQRETRIERDRAVVIGNGAVEIAFVIVGIAAVGEEFGLRRQPDGFIVVGDGAVVIAVLGIGQAAMSKYSGTSGSSRIASLSSAMARSLRPSFL